MKRIVIFLILIFVISCSKDKVTGVKVSINVESRLIPLIGLIKLKIIQNNRIVWWRNYNSPFSFPIELVVVKGNSPSANLTIDIYRTTSSKEPFITKSEQLIFEDGAIVELNIIIECPLDYCKTEPDGGNDREIEEDIYDITDIEDKEMEEERVELRIPVNPGCDPEVQAEGFDAVWSITEEGVTRYIKFTKGTKYWTFDLEAYGFLQNSCGDILQYWGNSTLYSADPLPPPWRDQNLIQNGIASAWTIINPTSYSTLYLQIASHISTSSTSYIWGENLALNEWIDSNNISGELLRIFQQGTSIGAGYLCPQPETYPGYDTTFQQKGISAMVGLLLLEGNTPKNFYWMFSGTSVWWFKIEQQDQFYPIILCKYSIDDYFRLFQPNDCSDPQVRRLNPGCDSEVISSGIDAAYEVILPDNTIRLRFLKGLKRWELLKNLTHQDWSWNEYIENFPQWLVTQFSPEGCPQPTDSTGWCP